MTHDRSRYSVPCGLVGRALRLEAFTDQIAVFSGAERVACHPRSYRRGSTQLELDHYLPAIERKPRAVTNAAVIARLPAVYQSVRDRLCAEHPQGYREFASILLLHKEFPAQAVADALSSALARGCVRQESVRQLLLNDIVTVAPSPIPVPEALSGAHIPPPDLTQYDCLLEVAP